MIGQHKNRKSVHVWVVGKASLQQKGTALFRGNDPLRMSAATTFSAISTSPLTSNMLDVARTGMVKETRAHSCMHVRKVACETGGSAPSEVCMLLQSHCYWGVLLEMWGKATDRFTALSQRVKVRKRWSLSAQLSERVTATANITSGQKRHRTALTKDQSVGSRQNWVNTASH